jgi:hypothetical protein
MKTLWNSDDHRELRERLERITPQSAALWGRMTAPQMIVHLSDAYRMAMGDLPCKPKKLPLRFFPLKQLVIYWLPFPKNAPTAPELVSRAPADWTAEVAELRTLMDRIASRGPSSCSAEHPAFGKVSGKGWGVLCYKHADHHLRQFGV